MGQYFGVNRAESVETLGENKVQPKVVTFANTAAGPLTIFTVTGDVIVRIIAVVSTNIASAADANISLGTTAINDAMIAATVAADMEAKEIWNDSVSSREIEPVDSLRGYLITDGNDIILTLDEQVDSGAIIFYCYWSALSVDGKVTS